MKKDRVKSKSKAKKCLVIVIVAIFLLILALFAASLIVDKYTQSKKQEEYVIDYDFYPADYNENIYENQEYLMLTSGSFIKFQDRNTSVIVGMTRESAAEHSQELSFVVEMIYDIINGDCEKYNARFSDKYYQTHEKKQPFTMQKIYDVNIAYISEEAADDGNYTKYSFCVEYKIFENNGTFRKDIGAGSRKQYITLTDRQGELLIDELNLQILKY